MGVKSMVGVQTLRGLVRIKTVRLMFKPSRVMGESKSLTDPI